MSTRIQITALDAIVNVNSLFTLALFLGLTWDPKDYQKDTLIEDAACIPKQQVASNMVTYQIYSFSSFLFSSLVALALKQAIRVAKSPIPTPPSLQSLHLPPDFFGHVSKDIFRTGILVSAIGSVSGSVCLMLALFNVVQFKLGTFGCGNGSHTVFAVVPLFIFVSLGLLLHSCIVLYAFTR